MDLRQVFMTRRRLAGFLPVFACILLAFSFAACSNVENGQAENDIRFVAFGDSGTGQQPQYDVAEAIRAKCSAERCDFVLLLGDIIYPLGVTSVDDPLWETNFELPYAQLDLLFYASLGNHDYGGDPARAAAQVAYAQQNPKFFLPAEFYSFQQGEATFLALDTHVMNSGTEAARLAAKAEQASFFSEALASSPSTWRVAFGHHPYISNGPHGNAGSYEGVPPRGEVVKQFFEDVLCDRVDLYLAGHDHNLQVLPGTSNCPMLFVIAGGGGKRVYSLSSTNPSLFQLSGLGFAYVSLSQDRIKVQIISVAGGLEYETEIFP